MTRYQPETKPCPLPPLLPSLLFFISLPSIKSSSSTRNRTSRWQSSSCFHRSNLPLNRPIFVCREGIDRNLPLHPFDILATHLFEANNRYGFFLYFEFETKGFRIVSFKKELKFEDLFFSVWIINLLQDKLLWFSLFAFKSFFPIDETLP